ncbi:MAG: glutathione S-transferase family protein [Dongiaceae bacterium]
MAMPILHGPNYSTYTRSARLALIEKNVAYELKELDLLGGATMHEAFLTLSPFGKVPVLEHRGLVIYETAAINRYVDEAFKGPMLQPTDPVARARMNQIIGVIDAYAYATLIGVIVMQRIVLPALSRRSNPQALRKAAPEMRRALLALEALAADAPFLAGRSVSLADLHLAPIMGFFSETPEGRRILPTLPRLAAWWPRMAARESIRTTVPRLP